MNLPTIFVIDSFFPNVKGVSENVAFIDHSISEDGEDGDEDDIRSSKTKSKTSDLVKNSEVSALVD